MRGELQTPVYSPFPIDGPVLACIPVDDGCLRLTVVLSAEREESVLEGALVGPDCHEMDEPLAAVETAHADVFVGHGALFVIGDLQMDEGPSIPVDVQAAPADNIDDAECD